MGAYISMVSSAFQGIKIAVGILIVDAGIKMVRKMKKTALPLIIMVCACAVMLCVNLFSWSFSSISLMVAAAAVSLAIFALQGVKKGGAA